MDTLRKFFIVTLLWAIFNLLSGQVKSQEYIEEEISFVSNDAEYSGTLSSPADGARHPLLILVSGMGPQDRDWSFAGGKYKMAKIMSDYFVSQGISVYRYDDRGFGRSTGVAEGLMSFEDLARDIENAVDFFRKKSDYSKIGLCGHSLGGILSVIAAAEKPDIDFLITLSGSFRNGADIMREQAQTLKRWKTSDEMTDSGVVEQGIKFSNSLVSYASDGTGEDTIRKILTDLITYQINKLSPEKMAENLKIYKDKDDLFRRSFQEVYDFYTSPHQKSFVTCNAANYISKIKCPLLVLFGEKDKNVVVESNRPPLVAGLANSQISDFTMKIVPGADHGYSNKELYTRGEMMPGLLDFMSDWILRPNF